MVQGLIMCKFGVLEWGGRGVRGGGGGLSERPQKVVEQKRGEGKQRFEKGGASWVNKWAPYELWAFW